MNINLEAPILVLEDIYELQLSDIPYHHPNTLYILGEAVYTQVEIITLLL
jgi:hypothetical protein